MERRGLGARARTEGRVVGVRSTVGGWREGGMDGSVGSAPKVKSRRGVGCTGGSPFSPACPRRS
jgi:hypothetical protein